MIFFCDLNIDLSHQAHDILDDLNQQLDIQNLKLKHLLEYLKILNDAIQTTDVFYNPDKITKLLRELKFNIDNLRKAISDLEKFKEFVTIVLNKLSINMTIKKEELDNYNSSYINWKKSMDSLSLKLENFNFLYVKNMKYIMAETIIGDSSFIDKKQDLAASSAFTPNVTPESDYKTNSTADVQDTNNVQTPADEQSATETQSTADEQNTTEAQVISDMSNNISVVQDTTNAKTNTESQSDNTNQPMASNEPVVTSEHTTSKPEKNDDISDNNVLFISETQNKVMLPYRIADLKKILQSNSHYSTLQEVIDKEYTFSLAKYKNAAISRFKETYNLMRKKEKSSILDSLDLALELSFNNLLNPAIISACRNLDELDIYLDCLALNELNKFNIFEIKYEIAPIAVSKKERF